MLTLGSYTPSAARIFGVLLSVMLGLFVAAIIPSHGLLTGTLVGLVLFGTGEAFPVVFRNAYLAWNRLARIYSRWAHRAVSAVCFVVITIAGTAGSSVAIARPRRDESLWIPRPDSDAAPTASQHVDNGPERSGVPALLAYARCSANWWVLALVPFFMLVRVLGAEIAEESSPDIYTLF